MAMFQCRIDIILHVMQADVMVMAMVPMLKLYQVCMSKNVKSYLVYVPLTQSSNAFLALSSRISSKLVLWFLVFLLPVHVSNAFLALSSKISSNFIIVI